MNRLLLVAFAAGCGAPAPLPAPISNKPPSETPAPPRPAAAKAAEVVVEEGRPDASGTTGIDGVVRDQANDVLAGVVVVAESDVTGVQTAVTNEKGTFTIFPLAPGGYRVTVYYADTKTIELAANVIDKHLTRIRIDRWKVSSYR